MTKIANAKLPRLSADRAEQRAQRPVDDKTLRAVSTITEAVRERGAAAVREYAERFGERAPGDPLVLTRAEMEGALQRISEADRAVLQRAADRIERFARVQREMFRDVEIDVPGGKAGHTVECVGSAGCYAPGGRYPLPSSVLMTAITARVAGCERVVVASPGANDVMLAAAAIAGADEFLCVGGAHGIAALAYGFDGFTRVDVVVGPGNKYVTGAKQLLSGVVGIDMLAGPSELLVIADDSADPGVVAADLLAQAEHDTDASAMLVTTSPELAEAVDAEIAAQLEKLPTRETASAALRNGFTCIVGSIGDAARVADAVAPEHLEIMTEDSAGVARMIRNAGGVFIGTGSAEVLGDYGAGPNHTLPTGGTARFQAGLSVSHFLRLRTWLRIDDADNASEMMRDTARLGEMEGLAGHASAARVRM